MVTHNKEIVRAQDNFRVSGPGRVGPPSRLLGKGESQDQSIFVGIAVIGFPASSFLKRPFFIKRPGRVIGFTHFQVDVNAAAAAYQVQKTAQQVRSQAAPPRGTAYRNVFNLPLRTGNLPGSQKAHHKIVLLDHQSNLVVRSLRRKQFCVLLRGPTRRRGGVCSDFHQPGKVGWLRWPHAYRTHADFVPSLACTALVPSLFNRLMSAPKILSRPILSGFL